MRRLIGVSTSPMVGSIYIMGVWDKVAAAWINVATRRTLAREEAARRRYKETGLSLENGGCIGDPHIVVDRCMVFLCILHCCMAIGRLQVAFIETRLVDLPKENTDAVQRALYRARMGVKLGATGAPDGEEARALFLAWEELGPLLDYVPEDGEWQAVVAMRDLLRESYTDKPPRGGPTCGRGGTRLPCTLLQGGVSIKLPPLFGGGCHRGRGQCTPLGGWVGCRVRGCR